MEISLEKIGINDAENAPSDVILLKILGNLRAIKNASAKSNAHYPTKSISLIKPKSLLKAVKKPTVRILFEDFL